MRFREFTKEQTIGTTGSSTGQVGSVTPVSQTPSDKSGTTSDPNKKTDTNPAVKQLDNLLKQNQINVNSVDDFLGAYTALQQNKNIETLPPEQKKALSDYTKATISKPSMTTQMSSLMKTIAMATPNKPKQA